MSIYDWDSEWELCKEENPLNTYLKLKTGKSLLQSLIEEHGNVEFISTNFKKRKNYLKADCAFHKGDKGGCLSLHHDVNGEYFNCFACGRHGNAVDFILDQLIRFYYPQKVNREDAFEAFKDYMISKRPL